MATWHLQQINNSNYPTIAGEHTATNGPGVNFATAGLFVSVYNNQQHFAYVDGNSNIQEVWYG